MIDASIGKRDAGRAFSIGFQERIVYTIRRRISTRLPAGVRLDLSEEPFFSVQFVLDHYPSHSSGLDLPEEADKSLQSSF